MYTAFRSEKELEERVAEAAKDGYQELEKEKLEALTFSPPRIPKSSPSYLIWSIFTKEREERNRQKAMKSGRIDEDDGEWLDVEDHQEMPNIKSIKSRSKNIDPKKFMRRCVYV